MVVETESVSFRIMADGVEVRGSSLVLDYKGEYVAEIPTKGVRKISDWGVVLYENTI